MIYILAGNDTKKKSVQIKALTKGSAPLLLRNSEVSEDVLRTHAGSTSLFGDSQSVILENILSQESLSLTNEILSELQDSPTTFIFLEDKLLASAEKKYKKYAAIERFELKEAKAAAKVNTFAIADMFGRKDKIGAWVLYRKAIESGIDPEPISGILFWKIKSMLLANTSAFTRESLKEQSRGLVSLYHRAHRGELDFVIGLEQFILSSLSK